jgi:hypothetical protein
MTIGGTIAAIITGTTILIGTGTTGIIIIAATGDEMTVGARRRAQISRQRAVPCN